MIGHTQVDVFQRMEDLRSTGIPGSFVLIYKVPVRDSFARGQEVYRALHSLRQSTDCELFWYKEQYQKDMIAEVFSFIKEEEDRFSEAHEGENPRTTA